MNSLGDYFKQAREEKGLSLPQIAEKTRIQEYHLHALESEDFENLPAKVFAKGFVRSYAKALGLDEDEALQHFLEASGGFYDQHQAEQAPSHVQVLLEGEPRKAMNWNLILGLIVVFVIGIVWYSLPDQQESQIVASEDSEVSSPIEPREEPVPSDLEPRDFQDPQEQESQKNVQVLPDESAPNPSSPSVVDAPPPRLAPKPPRSAPSAQAEPLDLSSSTELVESPRTAGPHILEIEATQLTWVVVKSDQKDPNEALLQPGQRNTWKADTEFLLTLGNAAGVVVRLNGHAQGPFGKPGQVVREIRLRP